MRTDPNEVAKLLATLKANIESAKACTLRGHIFAWQYGLAVKWRGGGIIAVHPWEADEFPADAKHWIENGKGTTAVLVERQIAIGAYIESTEALIASLQSAG